jgi:hypothetical protein
MCRLDFERALSSTDSLMVVTPRANNTQHSFEVPSLQARRDQQYQRRILVSMRVSAHK